MLLSINLNKIALLRNSRGSNYPNLESFALKALDMGAEGITLHPRPDHRHATSEDAIDILENLPALKTLNLIDEVSIGHAIIVDALNYGFEDTIKRYIQITKG